ncbi:YncE family protein [Paraliomyxa miuraensis]|uniref:YncE family protein n=1 Tax=Paraliomyxa miuraensis TaxID=376150 RepID=UPI002251C621|nr:hypothetical protein [Paraliomyxa miuraensis]MCX4241082.1 hypothetical protein [Paraliomyxa miuraensis]
MYTSSKGLIIVATALLGSGCTLVDNPALLTETGTDDDDSTAGSTSTDGSTGTAGSTSTDGSTGTSTTTDSTGENDQTWCVDADSDGFGDAAMCTQAVDMPPGTVNNGDDCNDSAPDAFPGAAPNDDPLLCMQDVDGDDWGDVMPPAGVDPGTDCDDSNASTFPGAAREEDDATACMQDEDGDGWGDANPDGGLVGGADCHDGNPNLNPDTLVLTAFTPYMGAMTLMTVEPTTAALGPFITLVTPMGGVPAVDVGSGTINEFGEIYVNDLGMNQLHTVDYAATCMVGMGELAPGGSSHGATTVCGLEHGADGMLYGIDNDDQLLTFDPATGQIMAMVPIMLDGASLDINSCGTAFDCAQGRLLVANGIDSSIYSIDTSSGEATRLRDLAPSIPGPWSPVGLEWNPRTRRVFLSTGSELREVDIDDETTEPVLIGMFTETNLTYLPRCM